MRKWMVVVQLVLCLLLCALTCCAADSPTSQPITVTRLWAVAQGIPGRFAAPNLHLSLATDYADGHAWMLAWDGDGGEWVIDVDLATFASEAVKLPAELVSPRNMVYPQGPYVLGTRIIVYGDKVGWYDLFTQQWTSAKNMPAVIGRPAALGRRLYFTVEENPLAQTYPHRSFSGLATSTPDLTDLRKIDVPAPLNQPGARFFVGKATRNETLDLFAVLTHPGGEVQNIFAEFSPRTGTWAFPRQDEWQKTGVFSPVGSPLPLAGLYKIEAQAGLSFAQTMDAPFVTTPVTFKPAVDAPAAVEDLAKHLNVPEGREIVALLPEGLLVISPRGIALIPKETVLARWPDAYSNFRWEAPHRLSLK